MALRACRAGFIVTFAVISLALPPKWAAGQGSLADYQRSESYAKRTSNLVFRDSIDPHWFGADMDRIWYRVRTGKQSHEFVVVDCGRGERRLAFDHEQLARQLAAQTSRKVDAEQIELRSLEFADDLNRCRFQFAGKSWTYAIPAGPLAKADDTAATTDRPSGVKPQQHIVRSVNGSDRAPIRFENRLDQTLEVFWMPQNGRPVSYGSVAAGESHDIESFQGHAWVLKTKSGDTVAAFVVDAFAELAIIDADTPKPKTTRPQPGRRNSGQSPDEKWRVANVGDNIRLIEIDSGEEVFVSDDGTEDDRYGGRVWWSPDSKHFVVMKTTAGQQRKIPLVESSPQQSIHANLITVNYAKPGDRIDHPRPVLFHVDDPRPILIEDELFANPFSLNDLQWNDASDSFSFVYNQRGHQVLRLVAVAAETAATRTIVEETPDTFVCYSSKSYVHRVNDDELIWMSERSGWNHLYLVDQKSGAIKNAITSGHWVVRDVERVDAEKRQIWLTAAGIDPDQDVYHRHLIRVNFDGSDLVRLTAGDGDHSWRYSPDERFLIDTFSRVDMPPQTQVRDAETGELICDLETADASALLETGWQPPERFVAKGRDGETDIYGIIVRPTNFDPQKRYPVIEAIYAGPHASFVPKKFGRHAELYSMAELGFIVVKIDGMGTNHRSKAFHDVCWQNLGDSGFPDRIAWMKAAARDRPEMDLARVGIWGGSAGGQSAMRALIAHGDFYHAAVADCGCHDNRVDKIWWNEQWMGWPIGPHYAEQSNVTQAHRLQGDLMLIWGELDRNVDPASTMQVINALVKADKDFEQLIMPGSGHGAAGRPYAKRRQADFLVRKLWQREPRHNPDASKDLLVAKTPTRDLLLDLYLPDNVSKPPLVVFIHGGGWQGGSFKDCKLSWLTEHGFAVASVSYRLTDEAIFPAQIHDCKAAIRYLRGNADRFGYDAEKIAVAGTSAGGHLAALLGTSGGVAELEGDLGDHTEQSSRVQAVIDFYGATDFILRSQTQPHRANKPGSVVYKLLGGGADVKTRLARLAGAATHVTSDDPPMLVLHGGKDKTVLLDQSQRIVDIYQQQGLDITLRVLPDGGHGGAEFMTGENRQAIIDFLQQHLRPETE